LVIAAIALALITLTKAFTSTKAGAEQVDRVMAGISATIDVLRDRVLLVGEAIGKFFSGDFKGAVEVGKEAIDGFGDEVAKEFKIAMQATKDLQEVTDAMRDLGVARAELDRDLAESERILTSTTASYQEKKKALEEVEAAEKKQTDAELKNAKKKLEAILALNAQSDSGAEDLDAEAEARIAVIELERLSSENRRKVADFNKTLDGEEEARKKGLHDAFLQREKDKQKIQEENAKNIKKEREEEAKRNKEAIALAEQKAIDEDDKIIEQGRRRREVRRMLAAEQAEDDKIVADAKKEAEEQAAAEKIQTEQNIQDAILSITQNGQNLISSLEALGLKKSKASQAIKKGLALTQIAADSAVAISTAIPMALNAGSEAAKIAGPAAAVVGPLVTAASLVGSIATVASNVAQAKKILSGGGSVSAGSVSTASAPTSAAPQVDFQASSENQIATTIADNTNEQEPIQAFVVTSEVTTGQELDRKKIEGNSF
jgi:hypothetical protein